MNARFVNQADPAGDERIPGRPRLAIDPGMSAANRVGSTVRIQGEIHGQQDLFVDGEVNGSVVLPGHTLTIGSKANVKATIKARNVVVVGNVEGDIEATERIELRGSSSLLGDVRSPRVVIENGAYLKGTVEVVRAGFGIPVGQDYPCGEHLVLLRSLSAGRQSWRS